MTQINSIESLTRFMNLTGGGLLTLSILKWLANKIFEVDGIPYTQEDVDKYFINVSLEIINSPDLEYQDRLNHIEKILWDDLENKYEAKFNRKLLENLIQNAQ